jgi:hypothetical protein
MGTAANRRSIFERLAKDQADIVTEFALVDEHPAARAIGRVSREHADGIVCMTSHGRGRLR